MKYEYENFVILSVVFFSILVFDLAKLDELDQFI